MSVEDHTLIDAPQGPAPIRFAGPEPHRRFHIGRRRDRPAKPRLKKLRFLFVLICFLALAGTSALFGMLTAVASDLGRLKPPVLSKSSVDSYMYDANNTPIGVLAPPDTPVLDHWGSISPYMRDAIIAVEDKRYWSDPGVDIRGLLRALTSDLTGGPREGGSTIAEEYVKNRLNQEDNRTIFEKLREAGLAFQLVHHWKRKVILVDYLNTIYFGNGANGIEAAARVYFGWAHGYNAVDPSEEKASGCGSPDLQNEHRKECAAVLTPAQAALLAGMVANPYAFDPVLHPAAATARRDLVLQDMYEQHYINRGQYENALSRPLPKANQIQQPEEPQAAPYFTSWVRPLIINALQQEGLSRKQAEYEAYFGDLKINLTLDLKLQEAAQTVVDDVFPPGSKNTPTASLVAIDNANGEVRAMVSGNSTYQQSPFNLATLGYRQPGSAFKIFTLAAALSQGTYGPDSLIDSKPIKIPFTQDGIPQIFTVHNFDNEYNGPETLATATAISDNSVFAQVGTSILPNQQASIDLIKSYAQKMGIRSNISTTPAMILGGLTQGVSALDMAHAYETVATGGYKIYNKVLGDYNRGPIGIASISGCVPCKQHTITNQHPDKQQVLKPEVAAEIAELLHGPVDDPYGTGTAAAIPGVDVAGKTGTTSNYVDAWFVGWTPQMTVAVWVGYPDSGKPMLKNYYGKPVEGGTFPAIIWHNFMVQALQIMADEQAAKQHKSATNLDLQTDTAPSTSSSSTQTEPTTASTSPTNSATGTSQSNSTNSSQTAANQQQPATGGQTGSNGVITTPSVTTTPSVSSGTQTPPSGGASTSPTSTNGGTGL